MRATMHKKDLKKSDGFPQHIDREKTVVVVVRKGLFAKIIYYQKTGELICCEAGSLYPKYAEGIYILK